MPWENILIFVHIGEVFSLCQHLKYTAYPGCSCHLQTAFERRLTALAEES